MIRLIRWNSSDLALHDDQPQNKLTNGMSSFFLLRTIKPNHERILWFYNLIKQMIGWIMFLKFLKLKPHLGFCPYNSFFKAIKWGAYYWWSSSLCCLMRKSDGMTIGKAHPTLLSRYSAFSYGLRAFFQSGVKFRIWNRSCTYSKFKYKKIEFAFQRKLCSLNRLNSEKFQNFHF